MSPYPPVRLTARGERLTFAVELLLALLFLAVLVAALVVIA